MIDYTKLVDKMRDLGMDQKWALTFVSRLKEDEELFPVTEEQRRWALQRGFYPGRIELLGLTEENYTGYLPDYHYSMMHPLNNHFLKWLDKLTLKYVLNSNGCAELMPDYYVYVENEKCGGRFTYLMECPEDIPKDEDFLWNLLQRQKILALKPNSGTSGGLGFIKLELKADGLYENNHLIDKARFDVIRDSMRNYIITEYIHQHHKLAKVWPGSECTLRVIMCKDPINDKYAKTTWSPVVSYARFGTETSGGASNLSSGGVGIGFDFETGLFLSNAVQYRKFAKDGNFLQPLHPDTKVSWSGFTLPNWKYVREKIDRLCQHISSLDYLGLDIIITEDGMKLCEINSLPSLDYEQIITGPVLENKKVRAFFDHKGLNGLKGEDMYNAYMDCQERD